ncbi:MAG: PhoD-like phosphatase, partial [Merismopedia sp. SIO2A8]|nr:PhoD-like phosphatase [Merismopedia sp. SIO2A8]
MLSREVHSRLLLCNRLQHLPLILAGPILRRTESDAVTVWVALKSPREVTLNIYATEDKGTTIETLLLSASRSTVPLGKHLHVIAVTAKPVSNQQLQPGRIYAYDLRFGHREPNLTQALNSSLPTPVTISYFNHQLPTFALPPDNLNDLRVAHGSCRKLHSSGEDALPIIDDL